MRIDVLVISFFVSNLFAQHRRCCRKDFVSCDHCPVDTETRVAQLSRLYTSFRMSGVAEGVANLNADHYIFTSIFKNNLCNAISQEGGPVLFLGEGITMLHDEDWIKINKDGSASATFTYVFVSSKSIFTSAFKVVQLWIPVEGQCNYKLKHETFTEYLCLAPN